MQIVIRFNSNHTESRKKREEREQMAREGGESGKGTRGNRAPFGQNQELEFPSRCSGRGITTSEALLHGQADERTR